MIQNLVIIGCGGFGREVADVVDAINRVEHIWNLLGFVDDAPSFENIARVERRGSFVIGNSKTLDLDSPPHFVVGIADADVRARLAAHAERERWLPATLAHPTAALGANLDLGPGSVVGAHVAIGSDVTVGRHVHLDRGAQVGHDSVLSDFVTVHPAAVISGANNIEAGVELGTNCTLLPGVTVGSRAVIGAAACVVSDVSAASRVKGIPAR